MNDAPAGERSRRVAATLMRMALALLERDGELLVAARLQQALDSIGFVAPVDAAHSAAKRCR